MMVHGLSFTNAFDVKNNIKFHPPLECSSFKTERDGEGTWFIGHKLMI